MATSLWKDLNQQNIITYYISILLYTDLRTILLWNQHLG